MRYAIFILALFLLPFVSFSQLDEYDKYEHILHYNSDVYIQKNCHVKVVETITVYAMGNQIQRGIFREIPTSYAYKGGNVRVGFKLLSLKKNGVPEPYHTENVSNGVRIYAGDANVYLTTGVYTYEITYDVHNVLGFFEKYDELYWNINGNGWEFTIDSMTANIYYPTGAKLVQYKGYTGKYGYVGSSYTAEPIEGGVHFLVTRKLVDHENLTVSVAWNKDQVTYPTKMEQLLFFIQWYFLWVLVIVGFIIGFFFNFKTWYKYGRDPKPGTIIPLFYAPSGFSPGECIYLKRGGSKSNTLFGSMLVSLAVKGMINIEVSGEKGLLSKRTYTLKNLNADPEKSDKPLTDLEKWFYTKLMGSRSTVTIKSGTYNSHLKTTMDTLVQKIDEEQKDRYFLRNTHLKWRQFLIPAFTLIAGIAGYFVFGGSIAVLVIGLILMLIMNIIFAFLYEQPTREGRQKMDEIAGFEMYMKYADRERIRLQNPPTMNFSHYEENLAYAIALGVSKEWAGQFDPVEMESSFNHHMPYLTGMMLSDFNNFGTELSNTVSSASTPPSSSGSTSGGGGFSGGGGGGGGGGGW